jgi:hypothetical protein
MSIGSVISSITHTIGRFFSASNLTAAEAWVAKVAPAFGDELIAFSAKLPGEFASLEKLAEEATALYHAAHGVTISRGLAIQLAQSVFTAHKADLEAEALKLLKLV